MCNRLNLRQTNIWFSTRLIVFWSSSVSLWPNNPKIHQRSGPTLVYSVPTHYFNQCWHILIETLSLEFCSTFMQYLICCDTLKTSATPCCGWLNHVTALSPDKPDVICYLKSCRIEMEMLCSMCLLNDNCALGIPAFTIALQLISDWNEKTIIQNRDVLRIHLK